MAAPICSRDTLVASGACYKLLTQDRERLAARVWLSILQLQAIGGTDYRAAIATLLTDSKCLRTMTLDQLRVAEIVIDANNAVNAGATVTTDINVLKGQIACLADYPDPTLKAMLLSLRCQLGYSADYPQ